MKLRWTQLAGSPREWLSTDGRYRLWKNEVTKNVFIYLTAGDVQLLARYNVPDAKRYAQEHADRQAQQRKTP